MREVKEDIRVYCAWRGWCREVLQQVRFWPDHPAIQKELVAHLDDGKADLLRLGYDQDLAEERALRGMGDPAEIGRALDRAHQPWLGWLWKVSQWLAVLALAWALLAVWRIGGLPDVGAWIAPDSWWEQELHYEDNVACPPPFQAGAYTMTVDHVNFDGKYVYLELTAQTPKFWLDGPELNQCLEAVDSNGVRYDGWSGVYGGNTSYGHFRNRLAINVWNIADAPEWIEIRHRTAGWSFRLDLSGGEEGAS